MTSLTLALLTPSTPSSALTALCSMRRAGRAGRRGERHLDVDLAVLALDRIDQAQVDDVHIQLGIVHLAQGGDQACLDRAWVIFLLSQ